VQYTLVDSQFGPVLVVSDHHGLVGVSFQAASTAVSIEANWSRADRKLAAARRQFSEYFAGTRRRFDLGLAPHGTPFQQAVWAELCRIPYGRARSYGELAARLGRPGAARAVGGANNKNPLAIVVPCHRVIGADGKLVGYAGGLEFKRGLLELEGVPFAEPS
jgi:methylated-DNA-[protein]-cysteine S-methyltransferase